MLMATSLFPHPSYLESTVQCQDDCVDEPSCNINVQTTENNVALCGNTIVTVTSSDW